MILLNGAELKSPCFKGLAGPLDFEFNGGFQLFEWYWKTGRRHLPFENVGFVIMLTVDYNAISPYICRSEKGNPMI